MRGCTIIVGFASVALATVFLRAEQTRCAARLVALESEWVTVRSSLWSVQARSARLRAPQQVHDRAVFLQADVVPPGQQSTPEKGERLARSDKGARHGSAGASR